jgi:hypothetical protein
MRKIFIRVAILITSFVMALSGLAASSVATASETQTVRVSATFPLGTWVLTKAQKTVIKKAVTTAGTDATFLVTGVAGKLPGVSDSAVQLLAKNRGQVVKAYLVKLGVSKASVTTKVKITRIGIVPKTRLVGTVASPALTTTSTSTPNTPITTAGAPTSVSATAGAAQGVVSWTAPASNGGAAIIAYTVTSTPGSFTCTTALTSCTVTGLTNGTAYTFTVAATNSVGTGSASSASNSVTPAALTCATGGTCAVGNTGPGGGLVYYVDTAGFSCGSGFTATGSPTGGKCNYLEVAPSGWNTGADPAKPWAVFANQSTGVTDITDEASVNNSSTGIGLGLKNSIAIVAQNGTYDATSNNYAAGAARAYAGNSKSDWYLPTTAELNLLCQWGRNVTQVVGTACTGGTLNTGTGANGGFVAGAYWSSSEKGANVAWGQQFLNAYQYDDGKTNFSYVRPVRAF